jgi:hypothetical protein
MMLAYFRKYPRDYTWHRAAVIVAFLSDSTTVRPISELLAD